MGLHLESIRWLLPGIAGVHALLGGTAGLTQPGYRYLRAGHKTVDHARLTTQRVLIDEIYKQHDIEESQRYLHSNPAAPLAKPTERQHSADAREEAYRLYDEQQASG